MSQDSVGGAVACLQMNYISTKKRLKYTQNTAELNLNTKWKIDFKLDNFTVFATILFSLSGQPGASKCILDNL